MSVALLANTVRVLAFSCHAKDSCDGFCGYIIYSFLLVAGKIKCSK